MAKQASDRIAELKAKKEQLAIRLAKLEAVEKAKDRKLDTRRKIIVGGAVLAAMDEDAALATQIRALLAAAVEREADRDAVADLLKR